VIVRHIFVAVSVAIAYLALAGVSAALAYSPADAWTVWLASGLTLGVLLARPREGWPAVLAGAFVAATIFALLLGSGPVEAAGYGAIEIATAAAGAWLASRFLGLPARLEQPRDLAALLLGGVLVLSLSGAFVAAVWNVASGGDSGVVTFRVWAIANVVGALLVAPLVIAWAQFRPKRSGGLPMTGFAAGAIAAFLFLATVYVLFRAGSGADLGGAAGKGPTYLPIMLMALIALLWGVRGATLIGFAGAVVALYYTAQGRGPFAHVQGFLGDPELEVQGYATAIVLTGLLVAVLGAAQRNAMRAARDWQTRFESAIAAHRLLAYEWDPASGRFAVTGDARDLLGVASDKLTTLADWMALVAADDRERVGARFDQRTAGEGASDTLTYLVTGGGGAALAVSDEARAIRDHDGALHRVVGIVRVNAPAAA
jgi:integral membrane sensor domain MASE1